MARDTRKKLLQVQITPALYVKLEKLAAKDGDTVSGYVRRVLTEALS
jgi:hypothetical protein